MTEEELKKRENNILYKPDLDYDKEYDTTGRTSEITQTNKETDKTSIIEELAKDINNIKQVLPLLPEDMRNAASNPLVVIDSVVGDLDDIDKKPISSDETLIIIDDKKEDSELDDVLPDTFFRDDDDPFVIISERKDKITVIKETYDYDLTSIIADYIHNLNEVLTNYFNNIMLAFMPLDKDLYSKVLTPYKVKSTDISKDYRHLSDLIVRSQLTRDMKIRMYNKMFNLDKTISHIRSCKAGVEQRLRYYEANYQDSAGYNDLLNNRLLENSRMMYDKKYKQNFFNLYKYLNSSVILLDECFKMYINEAQAKIILLEKEGKDLW